MARRKVTVWSVVLVMTPFLLLASSASVWAYSPLGEDTLSAVRGANECGVPKPCMLDNVCDDDNYMCKQRYVGGIALQRWGRGDGTVTADTREQCGSLYNGTNCDHYLGFCGGPRANEDPACAGR